MNRMKEDRWVDRCGKLHVCMYVVCLQKKIRTAMETVERIGA